MHNIALVGVGVGVGDSPMLCATRSLASILSGDVPLAALLNSRSNSWKLGSVRTTPVIACCVTRLARLRSKAPLTVLSPLGDCGDPCRLAIRFRLLESGT